MAFEKISQAGALNLLIDSGVELAWIHELEIFAKMGMSAGARVFTSI
jgi:hypothetical protein